MTPDIGFAIWFSLIGLCIVILIVIAIVKLFKEVHMWNFLLTLYDFVWTHLSGWKVIIGGLGLLCLALYNASVGDWQAFTTNLNLAIVALGLRHALYKMNKANGNGK